jgi:hypothetical protein
MKMGYGVERMETKHNFAFLLLLLDFLDFMQLLHFVWIGWISRSWVNA